MDETSSIKGIGQGFLTETGQLKSRDQLRTEESAARETKIVSADDGDFDAAVGRALGSVRTRFREDANTAISALNVNDDNLAAAKDLAEEQVAAAKDLKAAIKEKDSEAISAAKDKLAELDNQRAELKQRIDQNNREQSDAGRVSIRLGNQQKAVVDIREVEFERREAELTQVNTKDDAEQLIQAYKNDVASLKTQRQELKDTRGEVKEIVSEGEKEIQRVERDSIRSFDEAASRTEKLANDIRQSAQNVLSNVSVSAVQRLLSS